MSSDGIHDPGAAPHDLASLAAHWHAKARERVASTGAAPKLVAGSAELGELTVQIEHSPPSLTQHRTPRLRHRPLA